jgi:hypothetical protein
MILITFKPKLFAIFVDLGKYLKDLSVKTITQTYSAVLMAKIYKSKNNKD